MSSLLKIQTLPPRISADFRLSKGHAVLRPYITACAGCSKLRQLAYRRPIQPHRIYGQRIHRTYVSVKPAISIECAKKNENINMVVIKDPSGNSSRDHARNISLRNEEWRKEAPLQKQKQKMQLERQKLSNILGLVAGRSTSNVLVSATVNCEKFPLSKKNMNKWLESWKVNEEIRKHVKQTGMGNPQLSELSQNQKKFLQLSKLRQEGKTCNAETLDKALAYKTLDTTLSVGHFQRDKLKAKKQFQRNKSKTQKENVRKKSLLIMKAPPIIVDTEKIGNLFRKRSPEAEISEVEEGMEKEHVVIKKSFQVPKGFESNFQQLLGYGVDGERISAELLAYTEACISIGELDVALLTLRGALHKLHNASDDMKGNRFKVEVCVFNLLLRAYAGDQARLENIYSLLETMDNAGYSEAMPDIESYAALLECHGRNTRRLTKGIPKCLEIMKSKGLDIASIFTKCKLSDESREYIVKAIRMVHEDFMPPEYADESKYSCELLENLSSKNTTRVNPYAGVVSSEELSNLLEEQLRREEEQEVEVESILTATPAQLKKIQEAMTKLAKLEEHYREVLLSAIAERRNTLNAKFNRSSVYGINMGIFLSLLTDEQYADLILKAIHYTMTDIRSQSRSSLEVRLGEMVQRKYTMEMLKQKKSLDTLKMVYRDYLKMCTSEKMDHENHREAWLSLQKQHNRENKVNEFIGQMWTFGIKKQVGHQLLTVMMESLKVETESGPVPAFTTHFRKEGFHTKESMKLNDKLLQLYRQVYKMHFDTMKLPMLVPPLPWTSTKSGGMLITPVDLVRNGYTATVEKRLEDGHNSQMFPSFDTLNTLGVCPWKVNEPILDLAIKIFRDKGDMSLGIPYLPSSYGPLPKFKKEMTQKERFEVMTQRTKMRKERSENYSIWCTELYRLSIANMFRKDIFWLPCNMDFRSRVYTIAPFLQHMGGDLTRGLLLFGKGKPLGPHGLDWLKVHLTNLTGKKKKVPTATLR